MSADAPGRNRTIALYCVATMLFWMAQYIYLPTLPTYAQSKLDSLTLVGTVLSMYGLWQVLMRVPLGIASDWIGWRKPFLVAGFALSGVGAWILGTAGDFSGLMLGRAVTGLAACTWVPLVVAFNALFPGSSVVRASAILTLFNSLGRVAATAVTGSLNEAGGYELAFWAAVALSVLSIVVLLPVREQRVAAKPPSTGGLVRLVTRGDVMLPSLLSAVSQYANWAISFGFMPVLIARLSGSAMLQSAFVTLAIAALALGNFGAARLGDRWGARRLAYTSFIIQGAGLAVAAFNTDLLILAAAQVALGMAVGLGYPAFMGQSVRHVGDGERASAMGIHQSVYAIGTFAGPAVSGWLADLVGLQPMFAVTAAGCLALGLMGSRLLSDGEAVRESHRTAGVA